MNHKKKKIKKKTKIKVTDQPKRALTMIPIIPFFCQIHLMYSDNKFIFKQKL